MKISPLIPEGVRGSSIHKSGKAAKPWTDQDQTWHTYRPTDSSGNGNRREKVTLEPHGTFEGGSGVTNSKNVGKMPNSWTDCEHIWHTYADPSACEWT